MSKARMREVIREQVVTFMAEFMANMNRGAGGDEAGGGGAGGARAGGAEAGGGESGGAGASGVGVGTDIDGYTNRFHELALLCPRMVEPEQVKVEQYIRGLSKYICGDVTSSRPAGIDEAVRMAYQLMGQIIHVGSFKS
ncbi:hypothetical protein Tco_0125244 [Tanacetum coccineum]